MTASGGTGAPGSAEEARHQAESGAKEAREQLHRGAEDVKEAAEDLGTEARRAANDVMGEAKDKMRSAFEQQKRNAADEIADVAHALRSGAGDLEAHDKAYIARHVDSVAVGIDRAADNLRDQDFGALLGQVQGFARRQPGLFLGGMFATGFALARFVKSSAEREETGAADEPEDVPRAAAHPGGPGPRRTSPDDGPQAWGETGAHHGTRPSRSERAGQRSEQEGNIHGNR